MGRLMGIRWFGVGDLWSPSDFEDCTAMALDQIADAFKIPAEIIRRMEASQKED